MIYAKTRRFTGVLAGLGLCTLMACGDDGGATDGDDEGTTTNTTVDETTLPITVSASAADTTVSASGTSDTSSTTDATDTDTTTSTTTDDGTGTGDDSTSTSGDDSTTGGLVPVEVEFCILQSPDGLNGTAGQVLTPTVYTRFYIETVTDQTVFNDTDERVEVEIGYGADGSTPPTDWTWAEAVPNPGWDGSMAGGFGNENNDEYQADLTIAAAGTYDYAARVSGDGGDTWVYCDLNGNVEGGYSPDQAGDAVVTD